MSWAAVFKEMGKFMITIDPEWKFGGTPKELLAIVGIFSNRNPDIWIRPSHKVDGTARIDFKNSEPFCQGWAIAQSRPAGTFIALYASKSREWAYLEPVWEKFVSEAHRQGWYLEKANETELDRPRQGTNAKIRLNHTSGLIQPGEFEGNENLHLAAKSADAANELLAGLMQNRSTTVNAVEDTPLTNTQSVYLRHLRDKLVELFNEGDLRNLCFDLNIPYDFLSGQGTGDKARELVDYCRRHNRLTELLEHCRELRPRVDWDNL
jgi:hypothetical protein